MNDLHQISSCEVCGNPQLLPVLDLGPHPMCDDLVAVGDGRVCREYPIQILYCESCRTAHQRFQIPKQDLFPATYHYRSRFTADVLSGMAGLVESCDKQFGPLAGKLVLDIGCNDGSLLDFFDARGARTLGVEPTGACSDAVVKGHAAFNEFLTPELADRIGGAHGKPDLITFTNVFAHIEDLGSVVESLRRLMHPGTVIIIENHFLGSVLDANQFDTFYHEHPRTYSYTSFVHIAKALGVNLLGVEFPARYGGNIRVFMGNGTVTADNEASLRLLDERESRYLAQFQAMARAVTSWAARKRAAINEQVRLHGPLRAKAFPGRAAILVKLLGLTDSQVQAVYEKPGSMKIGHYLPGTRIPIRSDDELLALPPTQAPLLNLAWHISVEIRAYLAAAGYTGPVQDILSAEEFGAAQ